MGMEVRRMFNPLHTIREKIWGAQVPGRPKPRSTKEKQQDLTWRCRSRIIFMLAKDDGFL